MGTPNYMSPEQTRGQRLDTRSDLFSLGSKLYFAATGRLPFRADSPLECCTASKTRANASPSGQLTDSKTLADVINLLLEKEPEARFQSAVELHDLLQEYLAFLHHRSIDNRPEYVAQMQSLSLDNKKLWAGMTVASLAIVLTCFSAYGFVIAARDGWRKQESGNAIREASPQPISDLGNLASNPPFLFSKTDEEKTDDARTTDEKRVATEPLTKISLG